MKINGKNISQSIAETFSHFSEPVPRIAFNGPTFEGKSLISIQRTLNAIKENQNYIPENQVVMDSKQFQKRYYAKTLQDLKASNAKRLRLGLNAIDGESAAAMGRRDYGKLRTEDDIQQEREGILKFLREEAIETFEIDIILSPFDTEETIEKILKFYQEILMIREERGINACVHLLPLVPYPGTALYERYKSYIDIQDYGQLSGASAADLSIWKFEEEPFGLKCEKCFLMGFNMLHVLDEKDVNDANKIAYLNFLALSISYQYLQGKREFEEIDIGFPEYKDDPVVKSMFEVIKKAAEAE